MMSPRVSLMASLLCAGPACLSVSAQTEVTLELGASQIGPATGADTNDARFAMGGLRASHYTLGGSGVYASFLGGQVFGDSVGGSFASAIIEATARDQWSTRWSGSMDVKFLGFGVREPFSYRTLAGEMGTSVRYRSSSTSLRVGVVGGLGRSRSETWTRVRRLSDIAVTISEVDLWRIGTTAELLLGSPTFQIGVAGSSHKASGDIYSALGGRLVLGGSWGLVELRVDRWDTPFGYETTGGLALAIPLGSGWSLRGFFGRSEPDPLTLVQPGSGSGGFLLGRSLVSTAPDFVGSEAPFEILQYTDTGSRIRFSVDAPAGATHVQLLGDFTLWDPLPMRREGDRWIVELDVPVGTHHFGFLVDDEWYVPDDAPDVVPDEWGRRSATLVIEGAGL